MSQGVQISFIEAGYCVHPEKVAHRGGGWSAVPFPASVAVIDHPTEGVVLFDTGYSERFFTATKNFPNALYRWITPVFLDEGRTAKAQLKKAGIDERDVRHVILSHFHADHIGGVADFTKSNYIYQSESFEAVRRLGHISALRRAFLPSLLPTDFLERSRPVELAKFQAAPPELAGFGQAYDLFSDGTLWLVPLPGHCEGHVGLFVRTQSQDFFLTGDACYTRENYEQNSPSSAVTRLIFDDFGRYKETLSQLHAYSLLQSKVKIVPCHCTKTLATLPKLETRK